jgi:tight adherence protein C
VTGFFERAFPVVSFSTLVWVGLLLLVLWRHRPPGARVRALVEASPRDGSPRYQPEVLGGAVRRVLRVPLSDEHDRRLGGALLVGLGVLVVLATLSRGVRPFTLVGLSIGAGMVGWWWPHLRDRRADRARAAAIVAGLPDAIDLLAVAVGAGLTVPQAVSAVGARLEGPHGGALREVSRRVSLGTPRSQALDLLLVELGEPARPLVSALQGADRYGLPLGPTLERLAADARARRRRQAEAAARRIPIRLLFPLVLCTLPAFVLLTVVPLLAGSLSTLRPSTPSVDRSPPCCTSTSSSVPR